MTRVRVTSIFDSPVYTEARRASVASIGLPKLEEASSSRKEVDAEESDDAFPPSIPRFRRNEAESSGERPSSALGSVRRARQSVDVMSAYHMGEPIRETPSERTFGDDGATKRPASREKLLTKLNGILARTDRVFREPKKQPDKSSAEPVH